MYSKSKHIVNEIINAYNFLFIELILSSQNPVISNDTAFERQLENWGFTDIIYLYSTFFKENIKGKDNW
jgi:hypothetical protein